MIVESILTDFHIYFIHFYLDMLKIVYLCHWPMANLSFFQETQVSLMNFRVFALFLFKFVIFQYFIEFLLKIQLAHGV